MERTPQRSATTGPKSPAGEEKTILKTSSTCIPLAHLYIRCTRGSGSTDDYNITYISSSIFRRLSAPAPLPTPQPDSPKLSLSLSLCFIPLCTVFVHTYIYTYIILLSLLFFRILLLLLL